MKLFIDILGWSGSGFIIFAYALTLIENKKYLGYGKYLNLLGGTFNSHKLLLLQCNSTICNQSTLERDCNFNHLQIKK